MTHRIPLYRVTYAIESCRLASRRYHVYTMIDMIRRKLMTPATVALSSRMY
jgi:hypothetical protein